MARDIYGLDIGTSNIKIFYKDRDEFLNEKNIIAILNKTEIYAFGDEAFEMHEKAPDSIKVSFPVKCGVIADFDVTTSMLQEFIRKATNKSLMTKIRVIICIPSGVTAVERRAVKDATEAAGAKKVWVIEEPMAAAIAE